jgi:hypothetical protein
MWILILTLVSSSTSTGQSVAAVPGFTSEQACISAATAWQQQVRKTGEFRLAVGVCARA